MMSGSEVCPLHQQVVRVYKTSEVDTLERLAANGWDPVHNKQLRKGHLIRWQLYTLPRPFPELSVVYWVPAVGCKELQYFGVLYTAAYCWWSGHSSLPLGHGFVHFVGCALAATALHGLGLRNAGFAHDSSG